MTPEMSGEQTQLMPIFVKTSHFIVSAAFVISEKPSNEPTMACVPDTEQFITRKQRTKKTFCLESLLKGVTVDFCVLGLNRSYRHLKSVIKSTFVV